MTTGASSSLREFAELANPPEVLEQVGWFTLFLANAFLLFLLAGFIYAWVKRFRKGGSETHPSLLADAVSLSAWRLPWLDFAIFLGSAVVLVWFFQNLAFAGIRWWTGERADPENFALGHMVMFLLTVQLPLLLAVFGGRTLFPGHFPPAFSVARIPAIGLTCVTLDRYLRFIPLIFAINFLWGLGLLQLYELGWIAEPKPQELVLSFLQGGSLFAVIAFIVLAVVVAPVAEELFFRGCLYRYLKGVASQRLAMIVSAIVFALIHANLHSFLGLCVVGLILASLYERTGDLRTAMLFHAAFNATSVFLLLLLSHSGLDG